MLALLKTVLTIFVCFVQFSSGAVIKQNPYYLWWPWHTWPPRAHHTNGAPTTTRASTLTPLSTATTISYIPTTTSDDDGESITSFLPFETEAASACSNSDDDIVITSTASTVTVSPTEATSTKISSTVQITTVKPQSTQSTTLPPTTTTSRPPSTSSVSGVFWKPTAGVTWQIQILGTVDTSIAADVYDVDLFDTPASTIATLHTAGRKVICYFSAGSYEDWRPDQSSFQASDKGSAMQGWQGEWWLNTNSANVRSIMTKRIELAVSKGCDGVDPDNVDGYANANGIGLQEADAVDYLNFLANNAHSLGLAVGLKNAGGLINTVLPIMQYSVNEQCEEFNECDVYQPFVDAGKPVFRIEYPDDAPNISAETKEASCSVPAASGFSTVLKTNDLSAWVDPC